MRAPNTKLLSLLVLGSSLASCDAGFSEFFEHWDRPPSLGGFDLAEGVQLRDETYGVNDHGADPIGGLREIESIARDRFDRALLIDQPDFGPARLLRLNDSGQLEIGFGGSGTVNLVGAPHSLALDSMDRILVVGTILVQPPDLPPAYSRPVAHVTRYHDDGTLDTDFGVDGAVLIAAPEIDHNSEALDVRVDRSGGVLVFGHLLRPFELPYVTGRSQESEMFVARLTTDGVLDTSFGTSGIARAADPVPSRMGGADLDSAGRPVVTGFLIPGPFLDPEQTPLAVWRFALDGSPDLSFAAQGRFTRIETGSGLPVSLTGTRVVHDANRRILVAGNRMTDVRPFTEWPYVLANGQNGSPIYDVAMWCLTPEGILDASFGTGGVTVVPVSSSFGGTLGGDHFDLAVDLALDDQQRPLVAFLTEDPRWEGSSGYYVFQNTRACLFRLNTSGQLDPDFLGGAPAAITQAAPVGMALDSTGRLLLASNDAGVWRLEL